MEQTTLQEQLREIGAQLQAILADMPPVQGDTRESSVRSGVAFAINSVERVAALLEG